MISFIIPTKNESKTLAGTIKALRAYQGEHEIIVSDGRSSDGTIELARQLADRVVVWSGPGRQTISAGRNAGAAPARGDFLVFVDADVTIPEINQFMARALGQFDADSRLVALAVRYRVWPELATWFDRIVFWSVGFLFWIQNNWLRTGASGGEFQMIRTEAFRRLKGFNEQLAAAEDMDMFWRLAKIGRTKFDWGLSVYHTGRRAHQIGWPRLLWQWNANAFSVWWNKKSASAEWVEVR